jgi:hypothetical protein
MSRLSARSTSVDEVDETVLGSAVKSPNFIIPTVIFTPGFAKNNPKSIFGLMFVHEVSVKCCAVDRDMCGGTF